ncbi:MAG: nuclease-related domain-containing protein [Bacillota bacterium]|nr:nuclease-related domain-containing protein [Bacillota bacterium]
MIFIFEKEFTIPTAVSQIEALLNRILKDHMKRPLINEKARILRSGYYGEKNLNYFLSLLPEKNFYILHNLRLPVNSSYFQIDFLLISSKSIIILDGKNHSGTLIFEENQLIHKNNDVEKIYENPISSVYRHRTLLKNWLERYQISSIPIEYFVVVTNPSTKVIISPDYEEGEKESLDPVTY